MLNALRDPASMRSPVPSLLAGVMLPRGIFLYNHLLGDIVSSRRWNLLD